MIGHSLAKHAIAAVLSQQGWSNQVCLDLISHCSPVIKTKHQLRWNLACCQAGKPFFFLSISGVMKNTICVRVTWLGSGHATEATSSSRRSKTALCTQNVLPGLPHCDNLLCERPQHYVLFTTKLGCTETDSSDYYYYYYKGSGTRPINYQLHFTSPPYRYSYTRATTGTNIRDTVTLIL